MAINTSTYSQASPYYATPKFDNGKFLDLLIYRPIPKLANDVLTQIAPVYNLRPDLMAFDLYGNSALWWVFAARNPNTLFDPLWDFVAGTYIYIPTTGTLKAALGS